MRIPHFILALVLLVPAGAVADATVGAKDDFTLLHSWEGNVEQIPCGTCAFPPYLCLCPVAGTLSGISVILDGGPGGVLDAYLEVQELPSYGLETWNLADNRTGDYAAAGIGAVGAYLRNFGPTTLEVRLGLERDGTRWVTSDAEAIALPASSGWVPESFYLTESQMVRVAGGGSLAFVLADVDEIRLLHAGSEQWDGEGGGPLGLDDIVFPEPGGVAPPVACVALLGWLARRRAARRR